MDNAETARPHFANIPAPICQEVLAGRLVNVEAVSAPSGEVLGISVWERHSSVAGETLLAETIEHPKAVETTLALLAASPIPGPIDIDFVDIGGDMYILEVNTRFGGGYPTSHLAGADFPGLMAAAVQGHIAPLKSDYERGVKMMKKLTPIRFDDAIVKG